MTLLAWLVLLLLSIAVVAGTARVNRRGGGGPLWKDVTRALGWMGFSAGALFLGALFRLWLAEESRGDDRALRPFVSSGAAGVLALARRHLAPELAAELPKLADLEPGCAAE